ncbi:MAG: hypothetical protein OXC31_12375 [Spirochaetaceae bacterium]|nr:hypothetical protein [Spirochaetaceae bacterium]
MATLDDAVRLIEDGDWQAAHTIVQKDSSQIASWAHGIVHLMEGDRSNAGYWYRRAERDLPDDVEIESEIAALKAELARG